MKLANGGWIASTSWRACMCMYMCLYVCTCVKWHLLMRTMPTYCMCIFACPHAYALPIDMLVNGVGYKGVARDLVLRLKVIIIF